MEKTDRQYQNKKQTDSIGRQGGKQTNNDRRTTNESHPNGALLDSNYSNGSNAPKKGETFNNNIQGVRCNITSVGKTNPQTY
eukprot:2570737-Ditylum_brightwellii.AAC.1